MEEFRNQRTTEDWSSQEGFREELVLEAHLAEGAEPAEAVETNWVLQGGDQQQENLCFSNEHSMCKETGRTSARCVASRKRVLPLFKMWPLSLEESPP